MFAEGSEYPVYVSVHDPMVAVAARQWRENAVNLESYQAMGCDRVLLGQDPETGDYIILRPKEETDMEKSVFWAIRNAKEKLKTAYMDLEEMPGIQKGVRVMVKQLEEWEAEVDTATK